MNWQGVTIGASFALFTIWMERQGRWSLFAGAAAGDYVLTGSRTGSPQNPTVSGGTTPTQSPANATRVNQGVSEGAGSGQATLGNNAPPTLAPLPSGAPRPSGGGVQAGGPYSPPAYTGTGV